MMNGKLVSLGRAILKVLSLGGIIAMVMYTGSALAQAGGQSLGGIATGVTGSFSSFAKLMIAVSYIAGIGFCLGALFKFKQHKDNPQQVQLGQPIAMLVIGIILIFLPAVIAPAGATIFGTEGVAGGATGAGFSNIPGATGT